MTTQQIVRAAAVVAVWAALAACTPEGGRENYNKADEDTGQASPGTVLTPNSPSAPDSTQGVASDTLKAGAAGRTSSGAGPSTPTGNTRGTTGATAAPGAASTASPTRDSARAAAPPRP